MANGALKCMICLTASAGCIGFRTEIASSLVMMPTTSSDHHFFKGQGVVIPNEIVTFSFPLCIKIAGKNNIGSLGMIVGKDTAKSRHPETCNLFYGSSKAPKDKTMSYKDFLSIPKNTAGRVADPFATIPRVVMPDGTVPDKDSDVEQGRLVRFEGFDRAVFVPNRLPARAQLTTVLARGASATVAGPGDHINHVVLVTHSGMLPSSQDSKASPAAWAANAALGPFLVTGFPLHWVLAGQSPVAPDICHALRSGDVPQQWKPGTGTHTWSKKAQDKWWAMKARESKEAAELDKYVDADFEMPDDVIAGSLSLSCEQPGKFEVHVTFTQGNEPLTFHPKPEHFKSEGDRHMLVLADPAGHDKCSPAAGFTSNRDQLCGEITWTGPIDALTSTLTLSIPDTELWFDAWTFERNIWEADKQMYDETPGAPRPGKKPEPPRFSWVFSREWVA